MAQHKGAPKVAGRTKGTPNKSTALLKDMILAALDKAGGVEYLVEQAHANPAPFLTLVGKVLPMQVAGANGEPLQVIHSINLVPMSSYEPPMLTLVAMSDDEAA